jgi:Ca2+-binding EF-hand superfamily protein
MRRMLWGLVAAAVPATICWGQVAELFKRLDKNEDGVVTKEEVGEEKAALFERMLRNADKNGDGKLSKDEFGAGLKDAEPKPLPGGPAGLGGEGRFNFNPAEMIKRLDKNGDGKLQKDEVPEQMRERFARMDANGDGAVDGEEFARVAAMLRGDAPPGGTPGTRPAGAGNFPPFARILDADGNGELSAEEIAAAPAALKKLDKNGDGKLTADELLPPGSEPGRPGAPPGPSAGANLTDILSRLKQADANGDGKLSKEEVPERMKERFDEIDENKDGFIDQTEMKKVFERLRERFGSGRPGAERPEAEKKRPE